MAAPLGSVPAWIPQAQPGTLKCSFTCVAGTHAATETVLRTHVTDRADPSALRTNENVAETASSTSAALFEKLFLVVIFSSPLGGASRPDKLRRLARPIANDNAVRCRRRFV